MAALYRYLKDLWKLAVVALDLAAINQIFSLLDPLIFRHIVDSYATRYREHSSSKFIALLVNMVFTTLIGLAFVTIYAAKVHWSVAPAYLLTVPLLGSLSSLLSRRVKTVQKRIVTETTALAGATTESLRNIELVKS